MPIRFPRAHQQALKAADMRNVDYAIRNATGTDLPPTTIRATLPGDTRRLRGIPTIARGVTGTQPGTDPHTETCRRMGIQ